MADNGSHGHALEGGEHSHGVLPGVHHDTSFTAPADVDITLGDTHPGANLAGGGSRWWEEFNVGGGHVDDQSMVGLSASSGQLGTLSVIVWFLVDTQAPEPVLVYAPDWVGPDDVFSVVVGVPDDIDPASASLEVGPVVVDDQGYDRNNGTITFLCTAPPDAIEGTYDILITASDMVGNEATTDLGILGIDGTIPTIGHSIGEPRVGDSGFTWTTSATPINLTIEDAVSGPSTLQYTFEEAGPWTEYDPVNITILDGLPEGMHTVYYKGMDNAGNWAPTLDFDVNIDDSEPTVALMVDPSVPRGGTNEFTVSPDSVISFLADDGDGVGTELVRYMVTSISAETWRVYDMPFPVFTVTEWDAFGIQWAGTDLLGNTWMSHAMYTFTVDAAAPIPSPKGDLFLPGFTQESTLTVQGNIPGNVARFHYRIDGGGGGIIDIEPRSTFSFEVTLTEGPNTLLYALESPVGVMSPWVVGGTIVLDTVSPELVGETPATGTKDMRTEKVTVGLHFSEAVSVTSTVVKEGGKTIDVDVQMHPGNTSATLVFPDELAGNALVQIELEFEDGAGNTGSASLNYKTRAPSVGSDITGVILGLIAGLIIGMMLVFFFTFKRKEPSAVVHEGGVATTSIISPDEDMEWAEEREEEVDEVDEEEDDEDEPDDIEEEEDPADEDEPDIEAAEPDLDDEEPGPEPEEEPGTEKDETSDLDDEIDRLLEDARGGDENETRWQDEPSGADADDLPDPDAATVDPGSRF
jgi:hypothetical protein